MARIESESVVTQSVLERLIDREPDAKQEGAPTREPVHPPAEDFGPAGSGMAAEYAATPDAV